MKRLALLAMLLGFGVTPAFAQNPNTITPSPQTAGAASSGACTSNTNCATWDITNVRSVTLQVSGTFSGTLTFEGTTDGTNWVSISLVTLGTGLTTTTTTAVGQFSIVNSGLVGIRARMTTYASGTASVWAQLGQGGSIPLTVSGSVLPSSGCVSWNGDTWLQRTAAGKLGISATSCGGANDGTLTVGTLAFTGAQGFVGPTADVTWLRRTGSTVQRLYLAQSYTDASNYERLNIEVAGNIANLITQSSGTGANLSMVVGTVDTGTLSLRTANTNRWQVGTSGHLIAVADNTYDFGASGATRPRTIYAGTSVVSPAYTFNGTTGKTGATCSAFTAGGCTTSPEPVVYVTDYLVPWMSQAGYALPRTSELAEMRRQIADLSAHVALLTREGVR